VGHLEAWHPFFDRRVVSFAVALTDAERWRGSDSRYFQHRALRHLGRDKSAQRVSKAEFNEPFVAQMIALPLEDLFRRSHVADLGWVEPPAVSAAIAAIRRGDNSLATTVWTFVALEAWVRAVWGGSG
jgi:hypothetical protein